MNRIRSLPRSVNRYVKVGSHQLWIVAGIAVIAVATAVGFNVSWSWSNTWDWLSDEESNSATIRNVALVVAGVIAFPLAIWRAWAAQRQADASDESLLNERYQKGAEMLGDAALSVRLAGIYALQRLDSDYPREYHLQIMRLFSAFLRLPPEQNWEGKREDVESVLQAVASRGPDHLKIERVFDFKPNLIDADLKGMKIRPRTEVVFEFDPGSDDESMVEKSSFREDLSHTLFAGSDLSGAWLDHTNLSSCDFEETNLSKSHLSSSDLSRSEFRGTEIAGASLDGADLANTVFADVDLTDAHLAAANLSEACFNNTDLAGVNLERANVSDTHFSVWTIEGEFWGKRMFQEGKWSPGVRNLTQSQLDGAVADPDKPPKLSGLRDPETDERLVWRGNTTK